MAPVVGFGLDYNYDTAYVGSLRGLIDRYRGHLSHLSIVALPDLRAVDRFVELAGDVPVVHHLSNIAPANPHGVNWARLGAQDEMTAVLDARWCCEDVGIWSLGPYAIPYFAPPPFEPDVAEFVAVQIAEMERRVCRPFVAEVPSCTFVVGRMTLGEFFSHIVARGGCPLVLDVSHVVSYALATKCDPLRVLHTLPLDAVWEIHIAGGRTNPRHPDRYIDTHNHAILPQVFDVFDAALELCTNLRAVTFELGEAITTELIETGLGEIENRIALTRFRPLLDRPASIPAP